MTEAERIAAGLTLEATTAILAGEWRNSAVPPELVERVVVDTRGWHWTAPNMLGEAVRAALGKQPDA